MNSPDELLEEISRLQSALASAESEVERLQEEMGAARDEVRELADTVEAQGLEIGFLAETAEGILTDASAAGLSPELLEQIAQSIAANALLRGGKGPLLSYPQLLLHPGATSRIWEVIHQHDHRGVRDAFERMLTWRVPRIVHVFATLPPNIRADLVAPLVDKGSPCLLALLQGAPAAVHEVVDTQRLLQCSDREIRQRAILTLGQRNEPAATPTPVRRKPSL